MTSNSKILSVGLVCLDVVHVVKSYPVEDSDQRSLDQYYSRGGNAANSAAVMIELGHNAEYFGTLAENTLELAIIEKDFKEHRIEYSNSKSIPNCICPNSCVIINEQNGSRTIIHTNKNLSELTCKDFEELINLSDYNWIHFEGRNKNEVKKMIEHIRQNMPNLPISVEVEKPNRNFEELIPLGNIVFISKDIAKANGAKNKIEALDRFKSQIRPGAKLICAWGDQGASAYDSETGMTYQSDAFPPESLVDTVGAGDTFNATVIASLNRKMGLEKAISLGCKVAGAKIGQRGIKGLGKFYQN